MKDQDKTKDQLISELAEMRQRIAELEAADTTERKQVEEKVEHLNLVLRGIRNVNQLLTRERDCDRLLQGACQTLTETRGYHHAWIALLDESGGLVMTTEAGLSEDFLPLVERLKRGELTDCGQRALKQSGVVVTRDPFSACADCPLSSMYGGKGAVTVRLKYGGKVYGLLSVSISRDLAADEEERALFEEVAGDIAFALHNIELEEERTRAEEALAQEQYLLRTLLDNVPDHIYFKDTGSRFIRVSKAQAEWLGVSEPAQAVGKTDFDFFSEEHAQQAYADEQKVMRSGKPLVGIEEKETWPDGREAWVSTTKMPLRDDEGKVVGTFGVSRDITERKRTEEDLRQSYLKLQKTLEGTINTLVSAIEMRDPYTAGHQWRVTQLACAIANEMGLSEEQIEGLRMAGLVHDIGKMNVPAEILSKPGQLSDLEFGLIKTHAQVGHDILNGTIEFPWPVAQIVLQHHERMDGSGYPQGLSGDGIVLEARILAVADVVEAMASHRPYRPPRGIDKALEEISQNKGVLYDPEVVDACLKIFIERRFKFE